VSDDRLTLSTDEVANQLGVGIKIARRLVADGSIPSVRLSERRLRIPRSGLEDFLNAGSKPQAD
jgi:excisionase family DNA binding protein